MAMVVVRARILFRTFCTATTIPTKKPLHVCIVGSGPAGFYTAEKLVKQFQQVQVDLIDRLPMPFGLVRSGVAPDHPETKVVINQFTRVASGERCAYFGNVKLGNDVTLEELKELYHIVVLAYGAESDRKLNIFGEGLDGVHSAREFVWWYNGHPDCANLDVDLKRTDTAVILGQGNVALDAARLLLRPCQQVASTDIAEHALCALQESNIRTVYIVGRRGPAQAACTAKELREIMGIRGINVFVHKSDVQPSPYDEGEINASRKHKRVYELFCKAALEAPPMVGDKELHFVFYRSPSIILPSLDGMFVAGVRLEKTKLEGRSGGQQTAVGTGEFEDIPCGLVLKSIGYKSVPVPGLNFDEVKGIVPNVQGRVLKKLPEGDWSYEKGLYVVGWLKRGPVGIIGTNLICAEEVVGSIAEDLMNERVGGNSAGGREGLCLLLDRRNVRIITFNDWKKIDEEEVKRGSSKGKTREKFTKVEEALDVAGVGQSPKLESSTL